MARNNFLLWSLGRICRLIERILANDFDCIIVIEGKRGLGKSTLSYKIASRVKKFHKFNPYKDIVYSREEVIQNLADRNKSTIMADEMIAVAFNRDFYNETQKQLIKVFNVQRDRCNLFIACVPQFQVLDNQFKNLVKIRLTVIRRGLAIVHTPIKSIYKTDVWDSKLNEKVESSFLKFGSFKPQYGRLTTFKGLLHFPDLTEKQKRIYQAIKLEKRNVIIQKELPDAEKIKLTPTDTIIKMLDNKQITTPEQLDFACITLNIKPSSTRQGLYNKFRDEGKGRKLADFFEEKIIVTDKRKYKKDSSSTIPDILKG